MAGEPGSGYIENPLRPGKTQLNPPITSSWPSITRKPRYEMTTPRRFDDREAAATAAQEILDNYQARLPKNIASVGSRWPGNNIPVDEHKAYAVEYLEAAAMRKMKSLQAIQQIKA